MYQFQGIFHVNKETASKLSVVRLQIDCVCLKRKYHALPMIYWLCVAVTHPNYHDHIKIPHVHVVPRSTLHKVSFYVRLSYF